MKIQNVNYGSNFTQQSIKNKESQPKFGNKADAFDKFAALNIGGASPAKVIKKTSDNFTSILPEKQKRVISRFLAPKNLISLDSDIVINPKTTVKGLYQSGCSIYFNGTLAPEGELLAETNLFALNAEKISGKVRSVAGDVRIVTKKPIEGAEIQGRSVSIATTDTAASKVSINASEDADVFCSLSEGSSVKGPHLKFHSKGMVLKGVNIEGDKVYLNCRLSGNSTVKVKEKPLFGPDAIVDEGAKFIIDGEQKVF